MSRTKLTQNSIAAGAINANTMFAADVVGPHAIANTSTYSVNELLVGGTILLDNTGNIQINNGGTIGSTGDADAITIASNGVVTMNQIPVLSAGLNVSGGTIAGTLSTAAQGSVTSLGTLSALTVSGLTTSGTMKATSRLFVGDIATALPVSQGMYTWTQSHDASNRGGVTWYSTHNSASATEAVFAKGRSGAIGSFTTVQDGDTLGSITWCADDGTDMNAVSARISAAIDGTPGSNDVPGRLMFHTTADGAHNPSERMRIDDAGNVGIGTTSPVAKFAVVGGTSNATNLATAYSTAAFNITPKSTSGYSLAFGSGPSDYPYLQMSAGGSSVQALILQPYGGNIGIGTTAPSSILHTSVSSGANKIIVQNTAASQQSVLQLNTDSTTPGQCQIYMGKTSAATNGQVGYDPNSDYMYFYTTNSEKMRLLTDGKLGIGLTTPLRHLHVSGAGYEMTLSNTSMSTDRKNMNWFLSGDKAYWRMLNDAGNAGGGVIELDWSGNLKAGGAITGAASKMYGHLGSGNIGDSNVPYNSWGTANATYYIWTLPEAGTYLLLASMRIRLWDVGGMILSRLYNNTDSELVGASGASSFPGTQTGGSGGVRMNKENRDDAFQENVQISQQWIITVAAGKTIHHQMFSDNNSTSSSIQSDTNGRNSHIWYRIG